MYSQTTTATPPNNPMLGDADDLAMANPRLLAGRILKFGAAQAGPP